MGMRCKKHPFQAGGGVCATCLRERLFTLAAAQNGGGASSPAPRPAHAPRPAPPEAVAFPRSVSPYVSRRKSDASSLRHHHPSLLFFRTPQVGPAGSSGALEEGDIAYEYEKRRAGKFSVLATLFGGHHHDHHRSDDKDGGAKERKKHSWFAGIIPRRRKKQQQASEPAAASDSAAALPPSPPPARRACRVVSNRGLSPERDGSSGDDESSSPAADPPWRPSPSPMRKTTPGRRRQTSSMPSGFAVCLSPLVRPSPGRRHRGVPPPDPCSFSCELRPSPLHNLSTSAASITRCRSKKLADGGRFR